MLLKQRKSSIAACSESEMYPKDFPCCNPTSRALSKIAEEGAYAHAYGHGAGGGGKVEGVCNGDGAGDTKFAKKNSCHAPASAASSSVPGSATRRWNFPRPSWNWHPVRFTGRFKRRPSVAGGGGGVGGGGGGGSQFRSGAIQKGGGGGGRGRRTSGGLTMRQYYESSFEDLLVEDPEKPNCMSQFKQYCDVTSLHGFHYMMEYKRSYIERVFWMIFCAFGVVAALYMMGKIWEKWATNPVLTSVANTNYPIRDIPFPAVTICTVNKAVNEKLVIQGCNLNRTFSQMKSLIATLIDPSGRNNDNINKARDPKGEEAELAFKMLRLVAPKCEDYLLSCKWNSQAAKCSQLFKLTLTDTGYCCTFNGVEARFHRKLVREDDPEVRLHEAEYAFLQRAVWEYTDKFRARSSLPKGFASSGSSGGSHSHSHAHITIKEEEDENGNVTTTDSYTCSRVYDDDLFPGICKYLSRCRANPSLCEISSLEEVNITGPPPVTKKVFTEEFPFKAVGAGRSRGLSLIMDSLRCDTIPADSFKGLRVHIHHPENFASVGQRGFLVPPGMQTIVSLTATDTYGADSIRLFSPSRRGCYFSDEFNLVYYKKYSRSSCVVECENQYISDECDCVPYYAPGNYSVCPWEKIECASSALDEIQKRKRLSNDEVEGLNNTIDKKIFKFRTKADVKQQRTCIDICLPSCSETFYDSSVTTAPYPIHPFPNMTLSLREAIAEGYAALEDISYVVVSVSHLQLFFRENSIMQYKRDELYSWEDFVSNLGGVMSLTLGFSILSLVEVVYFFTMRFFGDKRSYTKEHLKTESVLDSLRFRY